MEQEFLSRLTAFFIGRNSMTTRYLDEYRHYSSMDWASKATKALQKAVDNGEPNAGIWQMWEDFKSADADYETMLKSAEKCTDIRVAELLAFDALLNNRPMGDILTLLVSKGHVEAKQIQDCEQTKVELPVDTLDSRIDLALRDGFLDGTECDYLLQMAAPLLVRATVVDPDTGERILDPVRTGFVARVKPENQTLFGLYIQSKLCQQQGVGLEQAEMLNVIEYTNGNEYKAHYDAFNLSRSGAEDAIRDGGQRTKTGIVCLTSALKGGATRFEALKQEVTLKAGQLLTFKNVNEDRNVNRLSLHCGTPVENGKKVIATQWCREKTTDYYRSLKELVY